MSGKTAKKRSAAAGKLVAKTRRRDERAGTFVVTDKRGRTARVTGPSERSAAALASIVRTHSEALKRLAKK